MAEGTISNPANATTQDIPHYTYDNPLLDDYQGFLVEIDGSVEVDLFALKRAAREGTTWVYHLTDAGAISKSSTGEPVLAEGATHWYLTSHHTPGFLIFEDETGTPRYVRYDDDSTGNLVASGTHPTDLMVHQGQYVGPYLEMICEDGHQIFRMTVNSANTISFTLHRDEPKRTNTIRLSQGVPFAARDDNDYIEAVIDLADIEMRLDEHEWGYGGVVVPRAGNMRISLAPLEADGAHTLDFLATQHWDTRHITVYSGSTADDPTNWPVIYRGQTASIEADEEQLYLSLRDYGIFMERTIHINTYTGLGFAEGTPDLEGTPKPLAYGRLRHVNAVLVDPVNHVYQVHDGAVTDTRIVYDRGLGLTSFGDITESGTLNFQSVWDWNPLASQAGGFLTDNGRGLFRLAAPPTGAVSADVDAYEEIEAPEWPRRIGDICKALAARTIPEIPIDEGSFDLYNDRIPQNANKYWSQEITLRQAFEELVGTTGGMIGINRFGQLFVRQLERRVPRDTITHDDMVDNVAFRKFQPPTPAREYRYGRNQCYTTLSDSDLEQVPNPNVKMLMSQDYRYGIIKMQEPYMRYASAKSITILSPFDFPADAGFWGRFIAGRQQISRWVYQITVFAKSFRYDLGDTVLIQHPRWELHQPKTGMIIGVHEQVNEQHTTLLVWG